MISSHTPPGTKVLYRPDGDPSADDFAIAAELPALSEGGHYTLHRIVECDDMSFGVALLETAAAQGKPVPVTLNGKKWSAFLFYRLEDFVPAALPQCLTELLDVAPVDAERGVSEPA
jgi:hypothetical protein